MAEREEPQDGTENTEPPEAPQGETTGTPLDEDAVWAQIVAGWDSEPPLGGGGWPEAENLPDGAARTVVEEAAPDEGTAAGPADPPVANGIPVIPRAFVVKAPSLGPRDYRAPEDDEDEGHFVPPEPPPLPQADVTTKFAWLAVLGGPLLILAFVLLGRPLAWWTVVLGVGGFLGGFGTLVGRMKNPDEDDDPHGGAVV